jgi:hypothetical protein
MRMLIGNSLGGCLQSLMRGEVSEDEVLMLITRTMAPDLARLMKVVEMYHSQGNFSASRPDQYEMAEFSLDDVQSLATRLYQDGKIHQPRNFGTYGGGFIHAGLAQGDGCWVEVSPLGINSNPIVVDAYEKYKILDSLTK